jgi:hypothetical protein
MTKKGISTQRYEYLKNPHPVHSSVERIGIMLLNIIPLPRMIFV